MAAGRQGYASAQPVESDAPLAESVASAWSDWFESETRGQYATARPVDRQRLKEGFGDIVTRAQADGGYVHPVEFLRGLSQDELTVVQNVQHLAAPIDVDSLTEEGALNLLLPPAAQVDLNRDGLTQTGIGYGMRFPSSNTPPEVVAAWEEATAGMSLGDRMIYELQMVSPIMMANIHVDEQGAFAYRVEPGDPDFVNPMAAADYSYVDATQTQLDGLDFSLSKGFISKDKYDRQRAFWQSFQRALQDRSAK